MSLPVGRRIAIDLGLTRNGIAISDREGIFATPLGSYSDEELLLTLKELAAEDDVLCIYVGLPKHLSGNEGSSAVFAREKAKIIAELDIAPVYLVDERLSTKSAERETEAVKRFGIDAVAAGQILEFALQGEKSKGNLFGEMFNG